jgi:toxin ParE1/3/4
MKYRVHVVRDAEEDMLDIWKYVVLSGSPGNAEELLDEFERAITSLENMPERGHIPPELRRVNVHAYREIHVKVYRIIYQITGADIFVHCILDGRRDIQDLLQERLLRTPRLSG